MRWLALAIGGVVCAAGLMGAVSPDTLVVLARATVTPTRLQVIGVLRIVIGVVFMLAAHSSRVPIVMRLLGALVIIAGVYTLQIDLPRAWQLLNGWTSNGPPFVRMVASGGAALGAVIVVLMALGPRKR